MDKTNVKERPFEALVLTEYGTQRENRYEGKTNGPDKDSGPLSGDFVDDFTIALLLWDCGCGMTP